MDKHLETRSLQTVRDILSNPQRLDMAVKLMCESDRCQGMLARLGGQLQYYIERERGSTLTTTSRHLRFLDTPAIAASTRTSTFNPADLRSGKMTVYCILPAEHLRSEAGLVRMWIASGLRSLQRGGIQETNRVHFVADEAAALGRLEPIDDALSMGRGFGGRLHLIYQSMAQLKICFPNGQDENVLANTTKVFFGTNDNTTAAYLSGHVGECTIVVESGGTSSGSSRQSSQGGQSQASSGSSTNSNYNWQLQARQLAKPEEIIALDPRTAITLAPNIRPLQTTLVPYFEEKRFGSPMSFLARAKLAFLTLFVSLVLFATSVILAMVVTQKYTVQSQSRFSQSFETSAASFPSRGSSRAFGTFPNSRRPQ